jgi:hypothetical protein
MKFSNLSDLHELLSKSMKFLDGIQIPTVRQFNAAECLFDIKYSHLQDEIE